MRESRTSGFVRGAHSNMCPYRDTPEPARPEEVTYNETFQALRKSLPDRPPFAHGGKRRSIKGIEFWCRRKGNDLGSSDRECPAQINSGKTAQSKRLIERFFHPRVR